MWVVGGCIIVGLLNLKVPGKQHWVVAVVAVVVITIWEILVVVVCAHRSYGCFLSGWNNKILDDDCGSFCLGFQAEILWWKSVN